MSEPERCSASCEGFPSLRTADLAAQRSDRQRSGGSRTDVAKTFLPGGAAGLEERPRTGWARRFSPGADVIVKARACKLLAEEGVPLPRWSGAELCVEAVKREVVATSRL